MNETSFWKRVWFFFKKPWVLVVTGVLIVVILIFAFSGGNKSPLEAITVVRGNISEEVSVTGSVKPVHDVDLSFEKSGLVATVSAQVGDKVYAGEPVVNLEKGDLEAQRTKAEADLATQKANLDKANVDLNNYYGSIPNILNDVYTKADDAVRKQLDSLFNNDESQSPTLAFLTKDISVDNDVRRLRLTATDSLNQWTSELSGIQANATPDELLKHLQSSINHLTIVRSLLSRSMDAIVNAIDSALNSSTADSYKANVNTGRTNVNAALSNLTTQQQSITSERAAIASLEAGIKSYEAAAESIKAQISKMTIYAPISGIVTVQNAKVGEIAPANGIMVSIISANNFEVEANVAEADIAKIKVGDQTEITLDTYGSDVIFEAKVSSIDPAETMVEGVATYKTKFQFLKKDDRVKSGMTANITIFTDKRENVLVIPQRVVMTKDGTRSVMIDLGEGKSEERVIKTGLKGADGNLEVIEGLNEGDRIIAGNS